MLKNVKFYFNLFSVFKIIIYFSKCSRITFLVIFLELFEKYITTKKVILELFEKYILVFK